MIVKTFFLVDFTCGWYQYWTIICPGCTSIEIHSDPIFCWKIRSIFCDRSEYYCHSCTWLSLISNVNQCCRCVAHAITNITNIFVSCVNFESAPNKAVEAFHYFCLSLCACNITKSSCSQDAMTQHCRVNALTADVNWMELFWCAASWKTSKLYLRCHFAFHLSVRIMLQHVHHYALTHMLSFLLQVAH